MVMLGLGLTGCTATRPMTREADTSSVFVLNGADGPGPWYDGLLKGLREGGAADNVEMVNWGGPWMVLMNMSFDPLHARAEARLVKRIRDAHLRSPEGRITLIGHSAGCGVILGALERLGDDERVDDVLLLAPAVSEDYRLNSAMTAVRGRLHVFHSGHDRLLLEFSTAVAGTYEGVRGSSAGLNGFTEVDELDAVTQTQLVHHPYRESWRGLGHEGGHFGYRAPRFAAEVLAPLAAGVVVAGRPLLAGVPTAR